VSHYKKRPDASGSDKLRGMRFTGHRAITLPVTSATRDI